MAKTRSQYIEEKGGDGVSFSLVDENTVARLQEDGDIVLPSKKIDIPKDERWNTKQMSSKLLAGILNGDSIPRIASSLTDVIGNNMVSATRNARTMVTGAENRGRFDSYKNLADQGVIQKKVWEATGDDRTRLSHRDVDEEEQDIDRLFSNGLMFPGDSSGPPDEVWNCRCTMSDHIVGFRKADGSVSYVDYDRGATEDQGDIETEKIVSIKNTVVPVTMSNYDQAYNEFREKRLTQIDDIEKFEQMDDTLNALIENNNFCMRIPTDDASVLSSILDDEKFKTQFETGTSGGQYSPDIRKKASENLFGTSQNIANSEYEKYGYLGSRDVSKDSAPQLMFYGDGVVTFKKDQLFDRTTITVGDSLRDAADGRYIMGSRVGNVDSTVAVGRPSMIDEFNDRIKNGIDKYGIDDASRVGSQVRSYLELQYHGDLTLKDVESITADKSIWDELSANPNYVKKLEDNNIICNYIENGKVKTYNFN